MGIRIIGYSSDEPKETFKVDFKKCGRCCYCECNLTPRTKTRDHIYPKSLGGRETKPCCRECNQEKGNKTLDQYIQYLGKQKYKTRFRSTSEWPRIDRKIKNAEKLRQL